MNLFEIIENAVNIDDNKVQMFIGSEKGRFSVDITNNGDFVTILEYDNDVWVVEDDLQSNYTHFTKDIDATIEAYIEDEEREEIIEEFKEILLKIKSA